jgi:glycosyltransferase involved in cell wall biosynthesis
MPYASLSSFREAKARGVVTCLNHVNAHFRTENAAFRREALDSSSADERERILAEQWPESLCRRVDEEVQLADFVMVPSAFVADDLVRRGVEPSRIELIPYGVDEERFTAPERDFSARSLQLLYVGQVGYRKGLRYIEAAVGAVSPRPEQVTVIGPIVNQSVGLAEALREFAYLGKVTGEDLPQYYAKADVFILPSLAEGMALVVLEAMASGLPVIVTEESGYGGVIRDGVEGFIIPARDSAAITQKLSLLSEDGDLRRRIGLAARARACEYTWARFEQTATDRLVERLL